MLVEEFGGKINLENKKNNLNPLDNAAVGGHLDTVRYEKRQTLDICILNILIRFSSGKLLRSLIFLNKNIAIEN